MLALVLMLWRLQQCWQQGLDCIMCIMSTGRTWAPAAEGSACLCQCSPRCSLQTISVLLQGSIQEHCMLQIGLGCWAGCCAGTYRVEMNRQLGVS